MTNREIHEMVVRWLASLTGITVILARQNTPRPPLPYIMVNPIGWEALHYHPSEIEYTNAENEDAEPIVIAAPVLDMEWRYSIFSYTDGDREPEDVLLPIIAAIKMQQPMEPMYPSFVVHNISQVRSVPEIVENVWEPRAQMDLFLRGVTKYGQIIDVIETFEDFELERVP